MKKIKILFFIPFMNGGGAERVVVTLLKYLDKDTFEPVLVMLEKKGAYLDLIPKHVEIIDLQVSQARYAIFKMISVIKKSQPDIVFGTLAHLNLVLALLRPFFSKNIQFIARESNTVSIRNKQEKYPRIFDWLYKHVYKNFDIIITQAQYMQRDLIENYAISPSKIIVIYNPVDHQSIFSKVSDLKRSTKKKHQLLAVGKLAYQKGFDMLIALMQCVDENSVLTIVGEGKEKKRLEQQCRELGLESRVKFVGFSDNPYAWMYQADLLLLPSRYEGLPNVVLEAQLLGLPVVAFDAPGGTAELIEDGVNGFLVKAFDQEMFCEKIAEAQRSDFDRESLKEKILIKFAVEKIIEKYENVFRNALI